MFSIQIPPQKRWQRDKQRVEPNMRVLDVYRRAKLRSAKTTGHETASDSGDHVRDVRERNDGMGA